MQLQLLGRHNVLQCAGGDGNGGAARAGCCWRECAQALGESCSQETSAGEVLLWRGARLVNDCYNSNPRALDCDGGCADGRSQAEAAGSSSLARCWSLEPKGESLHRAMRRAYGRPLGVDAVVGVRGLAEALVEGARVSGGDRGVLLALRRQRRPVRGCGSA